jgi:probable HAF family extracellular repeat protein
MSFQRAVRTLIVFSILAVSVAQSLAATGQGPEFQGVGDLAGGTFYSEVRAISPDGKWIAGETNGSNGYVAFYAPVGGTITPLPNMDGGGVPSTAEDISNNGVIAGYGIRTQPWLAYRGSTDGSAPQSLGYLDSDPFSRAFAVSQDGQVIVGDVESSAGLQAFRWTSATGMVGIGDLPGGTFQSFARGISGDGSTIVGVGTDASLSQATRWTPSGIQGLGTIFGTGSSSANAASYDGSVVVGVDESSGTRAFRWTAASGMVDIGRPAGANYAAAEDVSDDGSIVTGFSGISGSNVEHAFVSINGATPRTLEDLIQNGYHLPITGWTLTDALVNSDGTVYAGIGINPNGNTEGWIFVVPEPGAMGCVMCLAFILGRRKSAKPMP